MALPEIPLTQAHALTLYERRARTIWPLYGRYKLDFRCDGPPAVSVIIAVRNSLAETMISLAALRAQFSGAIELILVHADQSLAAQEIETYVTGATILPFGMSLNDASVREAGLICATAGVILLLADGIELAPGAVGNALARLAGDPAIGAVGARLVQPDGTLLEAGGIIWRDGTLQSYQQDASPLAAEANFTRDVEFCSTLFLLGRRDVLADLPQQATGIGGTTHDAADLCIRIGMAGFRVVYEPDALAFLTVQPPASLPDGQAAFVAAHADYLAARPVFDPAGAIQARSPRREQTRVLFIEDSIPLRRIGSGFVRSNDVLRAMIGSGASVTVVPMRENHLPLSMIRAEIPAAVEVMHELSAAGLGQFLDARAGCFDLIWIARTHNLDQLRDKLPRQERDKDGPPNFTFDAPAPVLRWPPEPTSLSSQIAGSDIALPWSVMVPVAAANVLTPADSAAASARSRDPAMQFGQAEGEAGTVRVVVDTEAVTSVRRYHSGIMANGCFRYCCCCRCRSGWVIW